MRTPAVVLFVLLAGVVAGGASATTPGANGVILFTQPRCPASVGFRCDALPQPCAVDPATGASFVPSLPLGAVPSPDGNSIAWTAVRDGALRLLVANAEGGEEASPAAADPTGSPPAWSPDGSSIAFEGASPTNPSPLDVGDLASGTVRALRSGAFDQSWSPDGGEIAVEAFDSNARPVIGAVRPDDGSLRFVTSVPNTPDQPGDSEPDWSPDSSQIAFTRRAFGLPEEIQTVARDGSHRRFVTDGSSPSWAPDGTRIALIRDGSVWTVEPDGVSPRELASVQGVDASRPRWLTVGQTGALRSVGTCDFAVDENDADARGSDGIDTFFVRAVRVLVEGNGGDDLFWTGEAPHPGPSFLDGGPGNDDFELYGGPSRVLGGTGDDRADAVFTAFPQQVSGGPGNDWIRGGSGNDVIDGGSGNDALYGVFGANTIHGGAGNDVVSAYSGSKRQRLFGGPGNDRVVGGGGPDLLYGGTGRDRIVGHRGNDVIHVQDGTRDVIDCGPGRDTVHADRIDLVAGDCERVFRSR